MTFLGIFGDILWNVLWHSPKCLATFPGMFGDIRRIVLNDYFRDFETMNDITIHYRNIQTLMTELSKIKYDLAPPIMDSLLNRITICYNCRNLQEFLSERNRTMFYGLETISYAHPNYVQFCRKSLNKGTQ